MPELTEPQDVSKAGGTPYEYLFAETEEKHPGFIDKLTKTLEEENV